MDQTTFVRQITKARISYERLAELLKEAWPERSYSKSTIGRWAAGEAAIPKRLAPTLAFVIGREAGRVDQIHGGILADIMANQDKILIDRKVYASLVHLSNLAVDNLEAQQREQENVSALHS